MRRLRPYTVGISLATLLAGCSLAPHYDVPNSLQTENYKEAGTWLAAKPTTADPQHWWQAFGDPALNELEARVAVDNQNLRSAVARYDQAQAALSVAQAALFPVIEGTADAARRKRSDNIPTSGVAGSGSASLSGAGAGSATTSGNGGTATSGSTAGAGRPYNDITAGGTVSYEVDLWGRARNAVAAAGAETEASRDDLAALTLSLQAQVAATYFSLRGFDAEADTLRQTIGVYQKALDLVERRHAGGIATAADVAQSRLQLENAKTQAADVDLQRTQAEHALAVLAGQAPSQFTLAAAPLTSVMPGIDPGLPATLLQRRPDIAAAERRVFAANAEIGVARAAYFPDLTLLATGGFESQAINNLFTAPSRFWSLGPQLSLSIFDAGRLGALTDEARAAYDAAVASYRQSVLGALQEVEDNLAAVRQLQLQQGTQQSATDAAKVALGQSDNRYKGGLDTFLDVSVRQNQYLQAQLALTDLQVRQLTAYARLVVALGGTMNGTANTMVGPDLKHP